MCVSHAPGGVGSRGIDIGVSWLICLMMRDSLLVIRCWWKETNSINEKRD